MLFLILTIPLSILAQERDSLFIKNGIDNPSLLSTHHFGIFSSRINTNFKHSPTNKKKLSFNYTSGNTFHPFLEVYYPENLEIRNQFSQTIWYARNFNFVNQETTPAEYLNMVFDAVIKEFRVNFSLPLNQQQELTFRMRSYLITNGKHPFSIFTSDETIEWFHSNIAGGEDPFGRRYYGLNEVNFEYLDRNGNTLKLTNNDFFIGGIEVSHHFYPKLKINENRNVFLNFGSHLGLNTSTFNPSLDFGVSANFIKNYTFKNQNQLDIGIGANVLRKNLLTFKDDAIDLGNNLFLATFEGNIEYTKVTAKGNFHALGINYQTQTRYNKIAEADYYHLRGKWQEINGGWHNSITTLYSSLSTWSLIYSYGRPNYKLSLFAKQDFKVNNAPDFQTGINLKLPILN
ncbi:hypothetical protein [Seonamhaeicola marinus]|uniref:Uncharacterized protein n=1 Tax=Seonamhaeicola marinus TaxID=1912246 RepID=A0A5D0HWU7_9FLAO|nr:hypothetical protein [Seonamhaeicola marinus]TYA74999.1 hypothetical protein FUA24_17005 [Seonamhaeicola marinus]